MKPWRVLLSMTTAWLVLDVTWTIKTNFRRSLEKDILKHTINYLRHKLIRCLGDVGAHRMKSISDLWVQFPDASPVEFKRRSSQSQEELELVQFAVDMDILTHTRDYLMSRVVACHEQRGLAGRQEYLDNEIKAVYHVEDESLNFAATSQFHAVSPSTPEITTQTTTTPPSTTLTTTTEKILAKYRLFVIYGKKVTCELAYIVSDDSRLICRDLRVDGGFRLPNADVCYDYGPDNWRSLGEIQASTFKVLDLKSFCAALAYSARIQGLVRDVKVSWGCGSTEARLSWVDGSWGNLVDDNGFLHDIACYFDTMIT